MNKNINLFRILSYFNISQIILIFLAFFTSFIFVPTKGYLAFSFYFSLISYILFISICLYLLLRYFKKTESEFKNIYKFIAFYPLVILIFNLIICSINYFDFNIIFGFIPLLINICFTFYYCAKVSAIKHQIKKDFINIQEYLFIDETKIKERNNLFLRFLAFFSLIFDTNGFHIMLVFLALIFKLKAFLIFVLVIFCLAELFQWFCSIWFFKKKIYNSIIPILAKAYLSISSIILFYFLISGLTDPMINMDEEVGYYALYTFANIVPFATIYFSISDSFSFIRLFFIKGETKEK